MRRYEGRMGRWDGLVWGIGLIAMGVVFLLHYLDLLEWGTWRTWWPGFVLFLGVIRLATARTPRRIGDSVTFLLIGVWLLIAANDWHGLGWNRSWPLALVAIGIGTLTRALLSFAMPRERDEEVHVDVQS